MNPSNREATDRRQTGQQGIRDLRCNDVVCPGFVQQTVIDQKEPPSPVPFSSS